MKIKVTISILTTMFLLLCSFAGAINITNGLDEQPNIIKETETENILTSKCWYTLPISGDTATAAALGLHFYDYEWDHHRDAWRYKIRLTGIYNGIKSEK